MKKIVVLSLDPGSTNCGYGVTRFQDDGTTLCYRVLENGKIECTFNDMRGDKVLEQALQFLAEVVAIAKKHKVTHFIAERFMVRGRFGASAEYINVMLGILMIGLSEIGIKHFKFIPAAQWKNEFNRRSKAYNFTLDDFYRMVCCEDHQVDGCTIGQYGAAHWLQIPFFEFIDPEGIEWYAKAINDSNVGHKIERIRCETLKQLIEVVAEATAKKAKAAAKRVGKAETQILKGAKKPPAKTKRKR